MNQRMLLESGKVFEGRRVSGIGADVVDDTETVFVPVYTEGIAEIVSITKPDKFVPNVSFTVGVMIKNTSAFTDRLFARITNVDTGDVLGVESLDLLPGAVSMPIPFPITLPQTTDFTGLVEAGHMVNGTDVVDDSETITILVHPEGIAEIVSVTAPEIFTPNVPFDIGVTIKNTSAFTDTLFVQLTNVDTGDDLGRQTISVNAGDTAPALAFPITLTQLTDFNGLIEVGHIED